VTILVTENSHYPILTKQILPSPTLLEAHKVGHCLF